MPTVRAGSPTPRRFASRWSPPRAGACGAGLRRRAERLGARLVLDATRPGVYSQTRFPPASLASGVVKEREKGAAAAPLPGACALERSLLVTSSE